MAINLVTKFSPDVDEKFAAESKTAMVTCQDYDWAGAHTVKVYKVTTAGMNNYDRNGATNPTSRYGTVADLSNTVEEMTLTRDRSFTFAIDKLDADETAGTLEGGKALERQLREVVIPEVDGYVYGKMAAGAGKKVTGKTLAASNIYDEIITGTEWLDDKEVPDDFRSIVVTPTTYKLLKKSPEVNLDCDVSEQQRLNGVVAKVDGMPVIKVPASRLPENFGFMICHKNSTVAPVKLAEYKIHEDVPGISGSLVEGRVVYDAFVLDNKADGIYTVINTPSA